MGVLALSLRLLAVSEIPPPKACCIFTLVQASVVVSILAFVVSVSTSSLLFPVVAGQAFEGLPTGLNLHFRENDGLFWFWKSASDRAQVRRARKPFLRFFRRSGRIV